VGDNPYIQAEDLNGLLRAHEDGVAACTLLSAVFPDTPPPYGRLIRGADGGVLRVVEELDATVQERLIREVNASVYLFDHVRLASRIGRIGNKNKKGEYYLTDIIAILNSDGEFVRAVPARNHQVSIGVNNNWEVAEAATHLNRLNMKRLAEENGVLFLQPDTTFVEMGVDIGADTVIHPCTILTGGVKIGERCQIGPYVSLCGGEIGAGQVITRSPL
jgi:bifunctional UDP-N-acetylglucosamine pyrophosphorylase/glucosamine-1-phosphate N-acetyltransferase